MKTLTNSLIIVLILLAASCSSNSKKNDVPTPAPPGQPATDTPLVKLGAYYFGGWYEGSSHIKPALVNDFPERRPVWGWITNTADAMKAQIDLAADAGLYFFSFCWYFNTQDLTENRPANNAITLFRNAPNKKRLKFCFLVANHDGYRIGPQNWLALKEHWKNAFKDSAYLRVDGKPLIIFFDPSNLVVNFGGAEPLKNMLSNFRDEVKAMGFPGAVIAGCPSASANGISGAVAAGFDALSGYNYHSSGFSSEIATPISNMTNAEANIIWPRFINSGAYYIPVATLNWDVRPWSSTPLTEKYFTGFGKSSVESSVKTIKKWILDNPATATKEKLGILYAWNEYGEGGWLTPSDILKDSLLQGLKTGLK